MTQQFNPSQNLADKKFSLGASRLLQQAQTQSNIPKILIEPAGYAKMSEVIHDFARPLLALDLERAFFEEAISTAIIAWNMALTLEHTPELTLEELILECFGADFMEEDNEDFLDQIRMLMRRKQKYFSKHQRLITDYEILASEEGFELKIMSEFV